MSNKKTRCGKRTLSVFLSVLMLLGALPHIAVDSAWFGRMFGVVRASASSTEGACGTNLFWSYSGCTLTITGSGEMENFENASCDGKKEIPSTVPWRYYSNEIENVILPSGLTSISNSAFAGCSKLTSINIPDAVTKIGEYAFQSCALTAVKLPSKLITIGLCAFSLCESLTTITIPESVIEIGDNAFTTCTKLSSIDIPASVERIGCSAFYQCSLLESAKIAEYSRLKTLGKSAFQYCDKLKSIDIPSGVTEIEACTFYGCKALNAVNIKPNSSLKKISESAFYGCTSLQSFFVPYTVSEIGEKAFYDTNINEIMIPRNIRTLGADFISKASSVDRVKIYGFNYSSAYHFSSEHTKFYPIEYFGDCGNDTDSDDYDSIKNVRWYVPYDSTILYIEGSGQMRDYQNLVGYALISMLSIGYELLPPCLKKYFESPTFNPDDYAPWVMNVINGKVEINAALLEKITQVSISAGIENIGDNSFCYFNKLSSAVIAKNSRLTSIGKYAFSNCEMLKSISLPSTVTAIREYAFSYCKALESIKFPRSLETIGNSAFYQCANLTSASLSTCIKLREIGDSAFYMTSFATVYIPESVQSIGNKAFANDCITSVIFNDGVKGADAVTVGTCFSPYAFSQRPEISVECVMGTKAEKYIDRYFVKPQKDYLYSGITGVSVSGVDVINNEFYINQKRSDGPDNFTFKIDARLINNTSQTNTFVDMHIVQSTTKLFGEYSHEWLTAHTHILENVFCNPNVDGIPYVSVNLAVKRADFIAKENVYAVMEIFNGSENYCLVTPILVGVFNKYISSFAFEQDESEDIVINFGAVDQFTIPTGSISSICESAINNGLQRPLSDDNSLDPKRGVVIVQNEDNITVKIGITIKNVVEHLGDYKKINKNIKGPMKLPKLGLKIEGIIVYKYNLSTKTYYTPTFDVNVELAVSAEGEVPIALACIPVMAAGLEITATGSFRTLATFEADKTTYDYTSGFSASLKGSLKALYTCEVFGEINYTYELNKRRVNKIPTSRKQTVTVGGKLGVSLSFFGLFKEEHIFYDQPWQKWVDGNKVGSNVQSDAVPMDSIIAADEIHVKAVELDEIDSPENMLVEGIDTDTGIDGTSTVTYSDKCYEFTEMKILEYSGGLIMFFMGADTENKYNFRTLMYSTKPAGSNSWSTALPVCKQGAIEKTNDKSFRAVSDGAKVYVTFTKANTVFTKDDVISPEGNYYGSTDAEMNELSKTYDVFASFIDFSDENPEFTTSNICSNDTYDIYSDIEIINNVPTVIWIGNSDNNFTGTGKANYLCMSKLESTTWDNTENTKWSHPAELVKDIGTVTSFDLGVLNSKGYAALTVDIDGDPNTTNKQQLCLIALDGKQHMINCSDSINCNASFVKYKDLDTLVWYNGGEISYITSPEAEPENLTDGALDLTVSSDFHFINCGADRYTLLYTVNNDTNSEVYVVYYDGKQWGEPLAITDAGDKYKFISSYDALYYKNEFIVPMTVKTIETGDNFGINGSKTLFNIVSYTPAKSFNFEITDISTAQSTVTISITNHSVNTVTDLNLHIFNGYGTLCNTTLDNLSIATGETVEQTISITLPDEVNYNNYSFELSSGTTKITKSAALYTVSNKVDLALTAKQLFGTADVKTVEITLTNKGETNSSPIDKLVYVANGVSHTVDLEKEIVITQDPNTLETVVTQQNFIIPAGKSVSLLYEISSNESIVNKINLPQGVDTITLTIPADANEERINTSDNSYEITIVNFDSTVKPSLTVSEATFDKSTPRDIATNSTFKIKKVEYNAVNISSHITIYSNNYAARISKDYLKNFAEGDYKFIFSFENTTDTCELLVRVTKTVALIVGDPYVGNTLSTTLSDADCYSTTWYKLLGTQSTIIGNANKYKVTAADVGKEIFAKICMFEGDEAQIESNRVTVVKADALPGIYDAPCATQITESSITLTAINDYHYKLDNGNWTDNPVFTNLKANTEYTFYMQKMETPSTKAGVISYATIKTNEHKHTEATEIKQPTCTEDGYTRTYCTAVNCDYSVTVNSAKLGHIFGEYTVNRQPTCTNPGEETASCQRQGCSQIDQKSIKTKSHSLDGGIVEKNASCTEDGSKVYRCSVCSYTQIEVISKLGHLYSSKTEVSTCTKEGRTYKKCSRCNDIIDETPLPLKAHSYGEYTVSVAPTCTESGIQEAFCNVCSNRTTRTVNALGHSFVYYNYNDDATCTLDGTQTATCGRVGCTQSDTKVLANSAKGHSYVLSRVITEPTCENTGKSAYVCSVCSMSEIERDISALGHEMQKTGHTDPTCTQEGSDIYTCTREGCDTGYTKPINKLDHLFTTVTSVVEPTCTQTGTITYTCSREGCNESSVEITVAKGHSLEKKYLVNPTCTQDGTYVMHCRISGCGYEEATVHNASALGHNIKTYTNKASYFNEGMTRQRCTRCSYIENSQVLPSLSGHDMVAFSTAATCTEKGLCTYKCNKEGCTFTLESTNEYIDQSASGYSFPESEHQYSSLSDSTWVYYAELSDAVTITFDERSAVKRNDKIIVYDLNGNTVKTFEDCTFGGQSVKINTAGFKIRLTSNLFTNAWGFKVEKVVGQTVKRTPNALGHSYSTTVFEPTCTEQGYTRRICSRCGEDTCIDFVNALGHNEVLVKRDFNSCVLGGTDHMACTVCGAKRDIPIAPKAHNYRETILACKQRQGEIFKCGTCVICSTTDYIKLESSWSSQYTEHGYVPVKTFYTCTSDGYTDYYCPHCNTWLPEETSIDTNLYKCTSYSSLMSKNWNYTGENGIVSIDLEFSNGSSLDSYDDILTIYDSNGETIKKFRGGLLADSIGGAKVTVPGNSFKLVLTTGLFGNDGGFSFTKITANADLKKIDAHHEYSYTVLKAANCTTPGVRDATCTVCSEIITGEIIPALGHIYSVEITNAPDCTHEGIKVNTCTRTGCSYIGEEAIEALGHNYTIETDKEPDCTHPGSNKLTCQRSGCGNIAHEEIPALGHSYKDTTASATCLNAAVITHTCSRCSDYYTSEGSPALGHNYRESHTNPTCTTAGIITHTCTRCSDTYTSAGASALGHSYEKITVNATCSKEGSITTKCSRCNNVESVKTLEKLAHADSNSDGRCDSCGLNLSGICSCKCHQTSGFKKFIYKITLIFWKLFRTNQYCSCGIKHY